MKTVILFGFILITATVLDAADNPSLESYAAHKSDLVRVTSEPQKMDSVTAFLCAPPAFPDPHGDKYIDVFISKPGLPILLEGKGTYPVGTAILKAKYPDKAATRTELYTGMVKREKGFNPTSGDWEYFILSGDGKKVVEQGKLASCMSCHNSYAATDYVTRLYPLGPKKP